MEIFGACENRLSYIFIITSYALKRPRGHQVGLHPPPPKLAPCPCGSPQGPLGRLIRGWPRSGLRWPPGPAAAVRVHFGAGPGSAAHWFAPFFQPPDIPPRSFELASGTSRF